MLGVHITMELSRMYLGMHAANQVLLGAAMGSWTALVAVFVLRPHFESYVTSLRESQDLNADRRKNRVVLGSVIGISAATVITFIVVYFIVVVPYKLPEEYAENLKLCGTKTYKASSFMVDQSSYATYPIGVFVGL